MPQKKVGYHYRDELLPGQPGYRIRIGRSGLDPTDTRTETAYQRGLFLRYLFGFKVRTQNPLLLFLMAIFGVIPFAFIVIGLIHSILNWQPPDWFLFSIVLFALLITGAITINFLLSIQMILAPKKSFQRAAFRNPTPSNHKKRLPKRRKDYH
jgi:hypothetical protein